MVDGYSQILGYGCTFILYYYGYGQFVDSLFVGLFFCGVDFERRALACTG